MAQDVDPLAAGCAALDRAAWNEAREWFEAALERDDDPAAWEGLSRAAWWQHDAEATLVARERAYRGFQRAGDRASAGRLAMWLGSDHLDLRADEAQASAWLRRAQTLLDDLEPCADHAWVTLLEADVVLRRGVDPGPAAERARRALELGRALGDAAVEAVARAVLGTALLATGDATTGLSELDEAAAIAVGEELDEAAAGWALCHTASGFAAVGELERAASWCRTLASFCASWSARNFFGVCRTAHGHVLATRGEWASAEDEFVGAIGELHGHIPPLATAQLGLLRVQQGRGEEARELLESALPLPPALVGLGYLQLEAGDASAAAETAERVLRNVAAECVLLRLPALELLARARCAADDLDAACAAAAEVVTLAARLGTRYLRGRSELVRALVASARGDHDAARTAAEDALDAFAAVRAPFDVAQARALLAGALDGLGRPERAAAEARAAREALEQLRRSAGAGPGGELSPRELQVLKLVAQGLSDVQVAERLVLSPHTVHRHMANVRAKLRQPSRAAAVAHAARTGLL